MYGWTTAQVKERAKTAFRNFGYWMPVLVMFILSLLPLANIQDDFSALFSALAGGVVFLIISVVGWIIPPQVIPEANGGGYVSVGASPLLGIIIVLSVTAMILLAAFALCPILVGKNRYFMEHRGYRAELGRIFWAFDCGHYLNVAKIMFLKPYCIVCTSDGFVGKEWLAENPGIDAKRAFALSKQMTMGKKFNIWWLEITFIGWWILCLFVCGMGQYFLVPYIQASYAEVYALMREEAHANGISDFSELPGFFPARG